MLKYIYLTSFSNMTSDWLADVSPVNQKPGFNFIFS